MKKIYVVIAILFFFCLTACAQSEQHVRGGGRIPLPLTPEESRWVRLPSNVAGRVPRNAKGELIETSTQVRRSSGTISMEVTGHNDAHFDGRCPVCLGEGKRSTVIAGMVSTTLAYSSTVYDEDGKPRFVNPNTTTSNYDCSNGHRFSVRYGNGKQWITEHAPRATLPRKIKRAKQAQRKYAHAQTPAKPASVVAPSSIPVPSEEAAQLKALQEEATKLQNDFNQKMQALQAQWNLINTRAALRAKLSPEQLDSLQTEPDGRGGFKWVPRKVEPVKEKP